MTHLTLVSHHLCPYVQRAVIALTEKSVPFERTYIDLSDKPGWFKAISPLGKVPLLQVDDAVLFESAAILEFLEDTTPNALHPANPVERARHRGWMEFGSTVLSDIAAFYSAPDVETLGLVSQRMRTRFERLETALREGPWFAGPDFSLVDAVFGPIFRYFDVFEELEVSDALAGLPKTASWRRLLAERTSVRDAAAPDYYDRLRRFLAARDSALGAQLRRQALAEA
jgi:glutathione S-transferase